MMTATEVLMEMEAEKYRQQYVDALLDNKAQAHYFLCHAVNGEPMSDDGTCSALHCVKARIVLERFGYQWLKEESK